MKVQLVFWNMESSLFEVSVTIKCEVRLCLMHEGNTYVYLNLTDTNSTK